MPLPLDVLLHEAEWRECAPDWDTTTLDDKVAAFEHFCSTYWTIRHPERGRIKFVLRDAQLETIEAWMQDRYSIVLKARQIGFSTLVAAYAVWLTYFYPDRHIIMLSRTERDAVKLLEKAKYGFKLLPQWMKDRGPLWEARQTQLAFSNESKIESLPSGNDPARGESVFLVIVDEWAFLPNPAEAWSAIEPIADVGGRVIGLSTANGEGNTFHELWAGSKPFGNATNRFKSLFFPWWAGDRDDEWYAAKKADLPDWQLAQEYPSDPDEAFLRSGRPVFNLDKLREVEPRDPAVGDLVIANGDPVFFPGDGGLLSVWERPQPNGVYVVGADVAEGLDHGDFSSAHVIDARNLRLVAHWHGKVDADLFGEAVLNGLGRWYNNALVGVESNNHGLTTLKFLQRTRYRNIYRERRHTQRNPEQSEALGHRTTQTTKPLVIDDLVAVMRDGKLDMPCERTLRELRTFVRDERGRMHGSPFDDRTMSLAIAVWMLRYVWLPEYKVDAKPAPWTFAWLEERLYSKSDRRQVRRIGEHSVRVAT